MTAQENRCTATVDVLWNRQRYPNQRCIHDADHTATDPHDEHIASVPGRSAYWKSGDRVWNKKLKRFEIHG